MTRRVVVAGISGQDGSFLAESYLQDGYEVHGIVRRKSDTRLDNIAHLKDRLTLHTGDLCDQSSLDAIIAAVQPDEVVNLAAQSFVTASFAAAESTSDITGLGALRVLEAVRKHAPKAKVYTAGSSEQFGATPPPQNEQSEFHPVSPYGASKVFACEITRVYREAYGLFACVGILFNHEGPRRGQEFLTRKVSIGVAKIALGLADHIALGNLDARRDWGHAADYVHAMRLMLAQDKPDDYVIGTGVDHSVRDFVIAALKAAKLEPDIEKYVRVDPAFYRPAEVNALRADASKARRVLGWVPTITFDELVCEMVENDIAKLKLGRT